MLQVASENSLGSGVTKNHTSKFHSIPMFNLSDLGARQLDSYAMM
jgi:hypothetical protein